MRVKKNDEGKEAECPNGTPPHKIEESVGDRNYNNNGYNDQGKEPECLVDTFTDLMEEYVSDLKMKITQNNYEEKN